MSSTLISLLGFITWALALLVLMEILRTKLVFVDKVKATDFDPQNSKMSPFMQRLARVQANCVENLPIFGGLMLVALVSNQEAITNSLALVFLGARIVQSLIHLYSLSELAITLRFTAFVVQMVIGCYWAYALIAAAF